MVCQAGGMCPNSQRPGHFPVSWPQPQPGAVFVADLPLLQVAAATAPLATALR